jgi:hypothetical protein
MNDTSLSQYLRTRGLYLDAKIVEKNDDPILGQEGLLKEATKMWETKQSLLTMVIQARIDAIGNYILHKAIPEEVIVMRQAIVELSAILDDFNKYKAEYGRMKTQEENNSDNTEATPITSPKEAEESIL